MENNKRKFNDLEPPFEKQRKNKSFLYYIKYYLCGIWYYT